MKKTLTQTLMELRSGTVVEEATNELNTLVAMVRNTGGYQIPTTPPADKQLSISRADALTPD